MIARPRLIPVWFEPPWRAELDPYVLRPLTAARFSTDFEAFMSSANHLQATFRTADPLPEDPADRWPAGTTLPGAYLDAAWCELEFRLGTSFTYMIMEPGEERQIGAAYIWPCAKAGFDAECQTWVREDLLAGDADGTTYRLFRGWVEGAWPLEPARTAWPGREIPWQDWDRMPAKPGG